MATHGFGIIQYIPDIQTRYDTYDPKKYNCIFINDDYIEPILNELNMIKTFSHTISKPLFGLEYCGITLIPPKSLSELENILLNQKNHQYDELINLIRQAYTENKFIIHYGI